MCLPSLSKSHLDGYMTRPDARSCHQTNFSEGGFVRKGPFFIFPFSKFFVCSDFLFPFFFRGDPGQLDVNFSRGLLPAGPFLNNTRGMGWGLRLMKCRK